MSFSDTNPLTPVHRRLGALAVSGFSRSGVATWLEVPEFSAVFDLGMCPLSSITMDHVFLSHGHSDHASALMRHAGLRAMAGNPTASTVFLPASLVPKLERLQAVLMEIEGDDPEQVASPTLVGMSPGQTLELPQRPGMVVEVFAVPHRVESLGFTLKAKRKKLKPEYAGLPGREIGALRAAGTVVQEETLDPVFTYLGDHTSDVFSEQPQVWSSPVLVVETTFFAADEYGRARKWGHTHLSEFAEALERFGDASKVEHLLLKHFSMRYSAREIHEAVDAAIPERFRSRVQVLID